MGADGAAIEVESLSKRYPRGERAALDGVSFSVARGVWLALLGPNGSGKSTLMRILATIEPPSAGGARVLGLDTRSAAPEVRARIGVVFQSPSLDRLLSVRENLELQGALAGLARGASRERIASLSEEMGLGARLDERVSSLSGGLARRADLARALMTEPELVLLDEPTTGLDPSARTAFLDAVQRRVDAGLTVVLSTHLFDEAERAGLVGMMHEGRLVAFGTPGELVGGGGASLRTDARWAANVSGAGLSSSRDGGGLIASGDAAALARAAEEIVRAGGRVTLGRTTLGDVYAERTGVGR